MAGRRRANRITARQLLGLGALALALFFMFSFAAESVDAYQLKSWRDRLYHEITAMEQERAELVSEIAYRQSPEYVDEALRAAGLLPTDVVRVVPATRVVMVSATATAVPAQSSMDTKAPPIDQRAFRNANWKAWKALILGFDD